MKNQMTHVKVLLGDKTEIKSLGARKFVGRPPCRGNQQVKMPDTGKVISDIGEWDELTVRELNKKNMTFLCRRCVIPAARSMKQMRREFRDHLVNVHKFS